MRHGKRDGNTTVAVGTAVLFLAVIGLTAVIAGSYNSRGSDNSYNSRSSDSSYTASSISSEESIAVTAVILLVVTAVITVTSVVLLADTAVTAVMLLAVTSVKDLIPII